MSSKAAIRRRALKLLPEVFKRDRGKCRYCGARLWMVRTIPVHRRVGHRHGVWVRWVDENGKQRRELAATCDHIKRVDEGGDSDIDNLVLSCFPCNKRMDQHAQWLRNL